MSKEKKSSIKTTQVFKLKYPVEYGSEIVTELTIRRPRAKDIKHMDFKSDGGFSMGDMMELAANVCDEPPQKIDMLDLADAMDLVGVLSDFLSGGQETGKS